MRCSICNNPNRYEIENAILALTTSGAGDKVSIETIAEQYNVSLDELKMHAMFHTPLISDADIKAIEYCAPSIESKPTGGSLSKKMGLREADILAKVANEYLVTLKTIGRRINRLAQTSSIDSEDKDQQAKVAKLLTKPMVELYIGLSSEIRQTVKTMAEMDRMLNGPEDQTGAGLAALAEAIRKSDGSQ